MRIAKTGQTGRMPRLICLRWAHMPFCRFCHALAQIHSYKMLKDVYPSLNDYPISSRNSVRGGAFSFFFFFFFFFTLREN